MEGIVLLTERTAESDMRARSIKADVGRQARLAHAAFLRDHRSNRRVGIGLGIDPRLSFEVARLKDHVGFMVALLGIDRANDSELVQHGRLFGQVLADLHPGQFGRDHTEGATVLIRPIGFRVPSVYLTGAAGHPQKNDTFRFGIASRSGGCSLGQ